MSNPAEKEKHDKMVELVERMLELNKRLNLSTLDQTTHVLTRGMMSSHEKELSSQEKKIITKQMDYSDREIDRLVYELYELTEEEIKIVEGEGVGCGGWYPPNPINEKRPHNEGAGLWILSIGMLFFQIYKFFFNLQIK